MISVVIKDSKFCPVFCCNNCGDMISDLAEGVALTIAVPSEKMKENVKVDVYHVHKFRCRENMQKHLREAIEWIELDQHLYFLCCNSEVGPTDLNKLRKLYTGIA